MFPYHRSALTAVLSNKAPLGRAAYARCVEQGILWSCNADDAAFSAIEDLEMPQLKTVFLELEGEPCIPRVRSDAVEILVIRPKYEDSQYEPEKWCVE
jgi:hypothetical protein